MNKLFYGTSVLAIAFATHALAQDQSASAQPAAENVVVLSEWHYEPLYSTGWSVEKIFDETDVVDTAGEEIGDVENIIFSDDGRVLSVIAEVGGVWDIGDTHVSIPWEEAQLSKDATRLTVPVTEDNVDEYSVFEKEFLFETDTDDIAKVEDDLETGTTVFKATDLMGDYAYLSENTRYGYVTDMIVNNGTISAVIVDAAAYGRPGFYAYPYYGYNVAPAYYPRYNLPYAADEIEVLEKFDYDQLSSQS